jgi:hypothetical protein
MTLAERVGESDLGQFLRWLLEPGTLDFRDVLEVLARPALFEAEWREWCAEQVRKNAPSAAECEADERAELRC